MVSKEPAPSLSEQDEVVGRSGGPAKSGGAASGIVKLLKRLPRKVLAILANLPLALGEMFVIAGLMALGTFFLSLSAFICLRVFMCFGKWEYMYILD